MAEENNKENSGSPKKEPSEEKKEEQPKPDWKILEEGILNELNTNPKYDKFFSQYNIWSVNSFKSIYSWRKSRALMWGPRIKEYQENLSLKYSNLAKEKLWEIQQRKLFDLQCRWRAELIKIPEISLTVDFLEWSEKIQECTFLSPISQEEFDLYISFIENSTLEEIDSRWLQWQEYEDFKEQYCNIDEGNYSEEIPAWYEYYEMKTGLGSLYMLKDLRKEKEDFYFKLGRKKRDTEYDEKHKNDPKPAPDNRPTLGYDEDTILDFMKQFEDHKMLDLMIAHNKDDEIEDDREFDEAIETLKYADEIVPIEYNDNWRLGIKKAANDYIKKRLLQELPKEYRNYLFRIKNGLGFEFEKENRSYDFDKYYKEVILEGRELNGEPRDFNF